jgi:hypothetical protein
VPVQGVTATTHAVRHPWIKRAVTTWLAARPPAPPVTDPVVHRARWERWQAGLHVKITLPAEWPARRRLVIWDHLTGHHTPDRVRWLFAPGVMGLSTPLAGSWLNRAASIQRILKRRALEGPHPQAAAEIIDGLEATARAWNPAPTPFVWGGKRAARRQRARERRHAVGGSGAGTRRPLRRRRPPSHYGNTRDK